VVRKSKSDDINHLVGLATCAEVPELDEDGPALVAALRAYGVEGIPAVWDSPDVEWASFDLVVIRSTWDYAERRDEFLDWAAGLRRVLNPLSVLRWSTDKRYLAELEAAGVPVVPTRFIEPGETFEPPDGRFVVKPVFSAGGRASARYEPEGAHAAAAHVESLHAEGRAAMVQPHVDGVETAGEIALIFLGGSYSHAVRKRVALRHGDPDAPELYLEEAVEAAEPTEADLRVAEAALSGAPFEPEEFLYARVDLVHDPEPLVLELELAEPSLYLLYADGAAERLAAPIADAVQRDG
jgi:glutathione synthase/RimK-type ligase-like ATP-grasp enzyme